MKIHNTHGKFIIDGVICVSSSEFSLRQCMYRNEIPLVGRNVGKLASRACSCVISSHCYENNPNEAHCLMLAIVHFFRFY